MSIFEEIKYILCYNACGKCNGDCSTCFCSNQAAAIISYMEELDSVRRLQSIQR